MANWLVSTLDLKASHWATMWSQIHFQELRSYRLLVVSLADELYRRERGTMPTSEEASSAHPQVAPLGRIGRARRRHDPDRARSGTVNEESPK